MGADLFESYAGSIIAPISLVAFAGAGDRRPTRPATTVSSTVLMFFRSPISSFIGMVASIIGSFLVKGGESTDCTRSARRSTWAPTSRWASPPSACSSARFWIFGDERRSSSKPWGLAVSVIGGLIVGWALGKTAEYYTSDQYGR